MNALIILMIYLASVALSIALNYAAMQLNSSLSPWPHGWFIPVVNTFVVFFLSITVTIYLIAKLLNLCYIVICNTFNVDRKRVLDASYWKRRWS